MTEPNGPPASSAQVRNEMPQSIEEAGALLGAAINFYGSESSTVIKPPKGTHSSFSVLSPVPSSTLLVRLHCLRALLRNAPTDEPLVAAPSILALLMKLLGASSTLASAATSAVAITPLTASSMAQNVLAGKVMASPSSGNSIVGASSTHGGPSNAGGPLIKRVEPPPMWSTPLRKLWVDCVVLCHALGDGLSGTARINLYGFVQNMIALAGTNPRSARAAGGTRIAALDVLAGLLKVPKLSSQLSSWALDVTQLVQRALRSSGNGEPTYRVASLRTACAVAVACRQSSLKLKPTHGNARLVLKSAMEDRAIVEAVKLLKQGTMDKFPEVRQATATLAAMLAPMLVHSSSAAGSGSGLGMSNLPGTDGRGEPSPTVSLEDVMTISFKNLDDESPDVAAGWAEAFARCMSTAIEYCRQVNAETGSRQGVDADGSGPASGGGNGTTSNGNSASNRITSSRKGTVLVSVCNTLRNAIKYLVGLFVKVGGELAAPRAGGPFSAGGRAVRLGICRTLVQLLRIQSQIGAVGESRDMSTKEVIMIILSMVGSDMDAQLNAPSRSSSSTVGHLNLDATTATPDESLRDAPPNPLFGQTPKKSHADPGIARVCASRVIREGISEMSTESAQISALHDIVALCKNNQAKLTGNQLQILLIEMSHLFATLGEATASVVEDAVASLKPCIVHKDHGVRHEAAVACASITALFPSEGTKLVQNSLNDIQLEHAELMALASTRKIEETPESTPRLLRFGRRAPVKEKKEDHSLKHQFAIHGIALTVSVIVRDLPKLPGGLSTDLFNDVLSVSELLVSSLFNEVLRNGNPSGACTSVRAGFIIICGCLRTGPSAIGQRFSTIFDLWQKMNKPMKTDDSFTALHELVCVDAMVASVVVFLKYCSELLLSVPDALSRTSMLLEELLAAFMPDGRLGREPPNPIAASRFENAKASILEAFAWLPPGSYPMVADSVFSFAAYHVNQASERDVPCSVLRSLINKEDHILDAETLPRATKVGQVGGACDLEEDLLILTGDMAHHSDRESVMHLVSDSAVDVGDDQILFRQSRSLGLYAYDSHEVKPPTPLHGVGTWQRPIDPSPCARVRLADASVQAFSATFSLKGGKEQQNAVQVLEDMLPSSNLQPTRTIVVPMHGAEQDKRAKTRQESAAVVNIVAVLLSCLKTIPLYEATHNVPVGLGPLWMNNAKDLLVTLLPSSSHEIRRAAAEGLALLATLGVTEDAHFLQSSVLHSLDELMQGNRNESKTRTVSFEPISAGRSGSLLTLACIQRTAMMIHTKRLLKASRRQNSSVKKSLLRLNNDEQVPTTQMITRILPSIACQGVRDFFGVRTYALHAFALILGHSKRFEQEPLDPTDEHLLRKSIELVEDNFAAAWTAASSDYDKGNEGEKLSSETSFLSALLRFMTLLVPYLRHVRSSDSGTATRFSYMARIIMECQDGHPSVVMEAMSFFEVLSKYQRLLPSASRYVQYSENALLGSIPFIISLLTPERSKIHHEARCTDEKACASSMKCVHIALQTVQELTTNGVMLTSLSGMSAAGAFIAKLEEVSGARHFIADSTHRSIAAPRNIELVLYKYAVVESEICGVLFRILRRCGAIRNRDRATKLLLQWVLMAKNLLSTTSIDIAEVNTLQAPFTIDAVIQHSLFQASKDASIVFDTMTAIRWQVKIVAVRIIDNAINELKTLLEQEELDFSSSATFDPVVARKAVQDACQTAQSNSLVQPGSYLALHFADILTVACSNCTATVDQAELQILQDNSTHLLANIIRCFGSVCDPQQPDNKLLEDSIPQLSSCIKNALSAWKEHPTLASYRLFLTGCDALHAFFNARLTTEKLTLKRIARSALFETGELRSFGPYDAVPDVPDGVESASLDTQGRLVLKLGKLEMAGIVSTKVPQIISEFKATQVEMAIHSAALAMDAIAVLIGSSLSMCGLPNETKSTSVASSLSTQSSVSSSPAKVRSGFFYDRIDAIDDFTKAQLVSRWAECGKNAMMFFAGHIDKSSDDGIDEDCKEWLKLLVPLLFAGFRDAMDALSSGAVQSTVSAGCAWNQSIDPSDIATKSLQGLTYAVRQSKILELDNWWSEQLDGLVRMVLAQIIEPSLASPAPGKPDSELPHELVYTSGSLIQQIVQSKTSLPAGSGSPLLTAILVPFDRLHHQSLTFGSLSVCAVITASLQSAAALIQNDEFDTAPTISAAVASVATNVLVKKYSDMSLNPARWSTTDAAGLAALKACLTREGAVTSSQKRSIATLMAKAQVWTAWKLVCATSGSDDSVIAPSLNTIREYLLCLSDDDRQLSTLQMLRETVQALPSPGAMTRRLTLALGAEIFAVLRSYATLHSDDPVRASAVPQAKQRRSEACADSMKLILATLPQLSEEELIPYLSILFETFVVIIRYNGLPNHPTPLPGESDPAVGRMCAQALLHIARSHPASFKACMAAGEGATASDQVRAVVEFAVRAEMSGYATGNTSGSSAAPVKKKLNLKGFTK